MMESQTERPSYVKWKDIEVEQLNPLIGRQFVVGKNVMIARILLKKGANVPLHQHHNEQVSYILEGALEFLIAGERIVRDRELVEVVDRPACARCLVAREARVRDDYVAT